MYNVTVTKRAQKNAMTMPWKRDIPLSSRFKLGSMLDL